MSSREKKTTITKKIDLKPQHLYPHYHDKTFFKAAMEYGIGPIHSARSTNNQNKIDLEILRLHQKVNNESGHDHFEVTQPE